MPRVSDRGGYLAGAAHPDDTEAALTAYETALFPRSAQAAAEATEILKICFGDNAPHSMVEFFTGAEQA